MVIYEIIELSVNTKLFYDSTGWTTVSSFYNQWFFDKCTCNFDLDVFLLLFIYV